MSRIVHKYPMPCPDALFHIPQGGRVVHCGLQREKVTMWVEVDVAQPKELRHFIVAATGQTLPEGTFEHCGTVIANDGDLVLHVYENRDYVLQQRGGKPT